MTTDSNILHARIKYAIKDTDIARMHARRDAPHIQDGVTYLPIGQVMKATGLNRHAIHRQTTPVKGIGVVLTTRTGWRFVRVPRSRYDERAPIYLELDSMRTDDIAEG